MTGVGGPHEGHPHPLQPAEREAVKARRARCFCLTSQSVTGEAMAARFLDNLDAIVAACANDGHFIFAVHRNRIERLAIGSR